MENEGFSGSDEIGIGITENASHGNQSKPKVDIEPEYSGLQLKRQIGPLTGISIVVGSIIGSGIFISPSGVLGGTGSVGASLLVWLACAVISMIGALCYAELGTSIRKSGSTYTYIKEALGSLPAFAYISTNVFVRRGSSFAVLMLTFATYLLDPLFDGCGPPQLTTRLLAAVGMITVSVVNAYSVRLAANIQVTFTATKLAALIVIITGGIYRLAIGETQNISRGFEGTLTDPSALVVAFYNGLWAYSGWDNLNSITEEVINPKRNIPLVIITSLILVTIVYLLTNISYFTVLTTDQIISVPAVAGEWGSIMLGPAAFIITLSVACSTFGSSNGSSLTETRLAFVAARDGNLPTFLSYISVTQYTPMMSVMLNCVMGLVFIMLGSSIRGLIGFLGFFNWFFIGLVHVSMIKMRITNKDTERPFKVPIVLPVIMVLVCGYLVVTPIAMNPAVEYIYACIIMAGSVVIYFPLIHFKLLAGMLDRVTMILQLVFQVSPTEYHED